MAQKNHLLWETRSCHPQLLLLQCPPVPARRCWPVHAVTLPRVRCCIIPLSACLRSVLLLCTALSHSCRCLVIASLLFCTWCDSLPSTVISITWEICWIIACENYTVKKKSFIKQRTNCCRFVVGKRGLTSSPCQWWNNRLKWQQGCTLDTF